METCPVFPANFFCNAGFYIHIVISLQHWQVFWSALIWFITNLFFVKQLIFPHKIDLICIELRHTPLVAEHRQIELQQWSTFGNSSGNRKEMHFVNSKYYKFVFWHCIYKALHSLLNQICMHEIYYVLYVAVYSLRVLCIIVLCTQYSFFYIIFMLMVILIFESVPWTNVWVISRT